MMSCRRVRRLVALWVGGDLAPRRVRRIEAHVAGCEACRLLAGRLRAGRDALAGFVEEPPDRVALRTVRQRVMARLDAAQADPAAGRTRPWRPAIGWKPALGAALLALGAAAVVLVQRATRGPDVREVVAARPTGAPSAVAPVPAPPVQTGTAPRPTERRAASAGPRQHPQVRAGARSVPPQARTASAEPLVIKIVTDDPEVVIYWVVDGKKG